MSKPRGPRYTLAQTTNHRTLVGVLVWAWLLVPPIIGGIVSGVIASRVLRRQEVRRAQA